MGVGSELLPGLPSECVSPLSSSKAVTRKVIVTSTNYQMSFLSSVLHTGLREV